MAVITALVAWGALALDWLLGEPRRHPLVGFGRLATWLEQRLWGKTRPRVRGALAVALLVLPPVGIAALLRGLPATAIATDLLLLYFALGHRSLDDHARPVARALRENRPEEARRLAARMVSRDAESLDAPAATVESVLENGNDALFGALFWFALAGGPGALGYRLVNTLDAMWGYRNERYEQFGWAAARLDDLLNWAPARLTALGYALAGRTRRALRCWRSQAGAWKSPNAGPVMASGAGALGIELGGPARYGGRWEPRPRLGEGRPPEARDIERALGLVRRSLGLWLGAFLLAGLVHA